ncbi:MAG: hypothetical protein QF464_09370 [Myxococcota bacterium]|nr:hypothetical protein [Myxococcota bacterium]
MRAAVIVWATLLCWSPSVAWACPACAGVGGDVYVTATGLMLGVAVGLGVGLCRWLPRLDHYCDACHPPGQERFRDET